MDKSIQRLKHIIKSTDWKDICMLIVLSFHLFLSNFYDNWSSFSQLLLRGDAYSQYCTEQEQRGPSLPDGRCAKQRLYVSKLLPITRFANFIFSSFAGLCYDKFGSLITASIGMVFILSCWSLFGFFINYHWCSVFASIFLGLSVDSLNFPSFIIKHRFPNSSNIVFAIGGASASAGTVVPMIINYILENTKFSFKSVVLTYAFTIFPIDWIMISIVFYKLRHYKDSEIDENTEESEGQTLWDCFKTVELLCISIYFFVVNFTLTYHQYFINETFKRDSIAVKILEFSMVASFIPCIIFGSFVERFGITYLLLFLNISGLLIPLLSLYPTQLSGIFISLFIMIIYSMFTTPIICYVNFRYHKRFFGVLSGIIFTIGGLSAMLCHPLFELCTTKTIRFIVNIVMIVIRSLTFIPLVYIHKHRNRGKIKK